MCSTTVVNCLYAHGINKSPLTTFEATIHLPWIVPFMSQQIMEIENDKCIGNYKLEHAPCFFRGITNLLEAFGVTCELFFIVNCTLCIIVSETISWRLIC